jgi:hypothetical protein
VAFLNTAHLPDGDDQLADERAGPWLEQVVGGGGRAHTGRARPPPAELLALREGLRQLADVNCGGRPDRAAVAGVEAVLRRTPLLVDLAAGGEPRLTPTAATSGGSPSRWRRPPTWRCGPWRVARLKVCGSPDCRWAFVDTTRNRSRRWWRHGGLRQPGQEPRLARPSDSRNQQIGLTGQPSTPRLGDRQHVNVGHGESRR